MSLYDQVTDLPLEVEECDLEFKLDATSAGWRRPTPSGSSI